MVGREKGQDYREQTSSPALLRFDIIIHKQAVHNYLFYSGQLPFATSVENQRGGIVNTVFHSARSIVENHVRSVAATYGSTVIPEEGEVPWSVRRDKALEFPFEGANGTRWIGKQFGLVDDEGYFVEMDGTTRSRAVHKYDRFGDFPTSHYYRSWLSRQPWLKDSVPEGY